MEQVVRFRTTPFRRTSPDQGPFRVHNIFRFFPARTNRLPMVAVSPWDAASTSWGPSLEPGASLPLDRVRCIFIYRRK